MDGIIKVAVLIYPGVELIDMNGPIDVFVKANSNINENRYQMFTVAESAEKVKSERSTISLIPDYTLTDCPAPDIIVIPGQIMPAGSSDAFGGGSETLIAWIKVQAQHPGIIIMSVCIGVYILANTGLLNNKRATTHWGAIQSGIQKKYSDIIFVKNERFVVDGNIISTGGVTSGIDGALYLISVMDGAEIAQQVADIMVYNMHAPLPPNTILPN